VILGCHVLALDVADPGSQARRQDVPFGVKGKTADRLG